MKLVFVFLYIITPSLFYYYYYYKIITFDSLLESILLPGDMYSRGAAAAGAAPTGPTPPGTAAGAKGANDYAGYGGYGYQQVCIKFP